MATTYTNGQAHPNSGFFRKDVLRKAVNNRYSLTRNEAAVRRMIRAGETGAAIAAAFGVSLSAVDQFKRSRGLTQKRERPADIIPARVVVGGSTEPVNSTPAPTIEALLEREADAAKAEYLAAVSRWDAASAALTAYRAAKARPANA